MRVALSIIHRNEMKILGYTEFEDVMQLLLSRQLWDVYGLNPSSTACCSGIGTWPFQMCGPPF